MLGFCQGFNGLPPAFPMGSVSVSLPPELLRGELTEQHWVKWGCAGRHLLGALHGKEVEKTRLLRMLLLSPWVA